MAIGSICEHCEAGFSAPDASVGTSVTCPTCGKNTRVLDENGVREVEERRKQRERRQEDHHSRLALLKELEERERTEGVRGGFEDSFRYFQPRAGSRNRRLRVLGHLLMIVSWAILVLGLVACTLSTVTFDILVIVALAIFCFAVLKFLSEACHTLADMADRQWDIRALLLDMFEKQERQQEGEKS
ncbi:MAG: hypothetical protein VYD70_02330 [Planctomycetota bacterium]|nr:hypothetical protein [Planctomycetota bacterium]